MNKNEKLIALHKALDLACVKLQKYEMSEDLFALSFLASGDFSKETLDIIDNSLDREYSAIFERITNGI